MSGEERRERIVSILSTTEKPVSGDALAKSMDVSRQVIVQDIALIRANGYEVLSTNRGYLIQSTGSSGVQRVFKIHHTDEQEEQEMNLIVDAGGRILDVFVYHKVYGVVKAELNIRSRLEVQKYLKEIASGQSSLLQNVTSGYHYHTVEAESTEILDMIQEALQQAGFLARLQDYEPVDFWSKKEA